MNIINSGDTAFMLVTAALVLFMTPGLPFFYGGLVRSKNVVNTMMMSFVPLGVVADQWVLFGYSIAFGPNGGPFGWFVGGAAVVRSGGGRSLSAAGVCGDSPSSALYEVAEPADQMGTRQFP